MSDTNRTTETMTTTPEPWSIDQEWIDRVKHEHPEYVAINVGDSCFVTGHIGITKGRLIVAAPELLALAKRYASECLNCLGHGVLEKQIGGDGYGDLCAGVADVEVDCDECAEIRAVIAKAEGRDHG